MKTKVCKTASSSSIKLRFGGAWRRICFALLLLVLTTMTAWAENVNLAEDNDIAVGTAGHYYVNMPVTGTNTLTITAEDIAAGKGTFKVYDDGGKSSNYSNDCNGNLVLKAPTGYVFQLSGNIKTGGIYDKLTVYDNNEASGTKLIDAVYSPAPDYNNIAIYTVTSTSTDMTLNFTTNFLSNYAGLDLTVSLVNTSTEYNVIVDNSSATGGSVASNKEKANVNETVTLTATPASSDYLFNGISVTGANSNAVAAAGGWYSNNQATFTMPGSAVTVTPTFTNDLANLYVNMPKTGEKDVTIPSSVQSFKVYDDGGSVGKYNQNCDGTLVLTAPTGYVLQLSGSVKTNGSDDKLTVYDGSNVNGTTLGDPLFGTVSDINKTCTGTVMTLCFSTNNFYEEDGLDLTVTLVSANQDYGISFGVVDNGSISASVGSVNNVTTAKANDEVTLTATPGDGYLLSGISVTDGSSNPVPVTWDGPFSNTATFTMPGSDVTVTPTFTNNLTAADGLYINMPATDSKTITIPSGVQSFKVYDDGGSSSDYSTSCNGTLVLTAPEGYVLQLSGNITSESYHDKLTVYNGGTTSSSKLINEVCNSSGTAINTVSTGNVMTLKFVSDNGLNYDGFDLTVTLVDPNADFNINVDNSSATGGSVESDKDKAKVTNLITLTATPDNNYLLSGISVTDANSNPVAVTWDGSFSNTATFNMPISDVTVTPTFTNTLTAAGGLFINVSATGSNNVREIQIPNGVQSFKVYDDGGVNGIYSNSFEGTLMLTAPTGYVLQLSGGITTEAKYDKLTVYDGSKASGNVLLNAVSGTLNDIDKTSTGNVMTIHFKSDGSGNNFAGLDLTVTLFKDIATCKITVPNQTLSASSTNPELGVRNYSYIGYKFDEAKEPYYGVSVGESVKDGETTLTLGTDYTFGNVYYSDGNGHIINPESPTSPNQVGDECLVEIVGIGKYTGTAYAPFRIIVPDASDDDWETDFKWAYHDGKLTISKKDGVDGNKAMPEKSANTQYPWYSIANGVFEVNIEEGITSVAANAFAGTSNVHSYGNLASINLPSTLTTIGDNAFAFDSALPSVEIPASVTSIGTNAFYQCGSLNSVILNSNPTIGAEAFSEIKEGAKVTMNLAAAEVDGAHWTTFYNNYGNFQADANTEVYKGAVSESKLVLTPIDDKIVTKEQAVILKSTGTPIVMTLKADGITGDYSDNDLHGVSVRTLASEVKTTYGASTLTLYVMGNTSKGFGFHKYTGAYMPANKAFLALSSGSSAPLRMVFDDDTSIEAISQDAAGQEGIYDLQGRKVDQPSRGLYIVNGKKVMIK